MYRLICVIRPAPDMVAVKQSTGTMLGRSGQLRGWNRRRLGALAAGVAVEAASGGRPVRLLGVRSIQLWKPSAARPRLDIR